MNIKKINKMFDKPTSEELENYQESVFLHIDDEILKYKKEIKEIYENDGKPMVNEMTVMIEKIDERLLELKNIEKRIDEKIIKLNQFKELI